MSTLTNVQFIEQGGRPVFVVIPYEEYLKLLPPEKVTIPHEVVGLVVKKDMNLVKAWRTYLGMSQAALSQMEKSENKLRNATLEKLAETMGLSAQQLRD